MSAHHTAGEPTAPRTRTAAPTQPGHEIGAGYANAFHVTAAALAGLFLLTLVAVPNDKPQHGCHGHGPGH